MDIFLDLRDGSFIIDPDDEDLAKNNKQRFVILANAMDTKWPLLPGSPVKKGAEFDGFAYTDLVSVDDGEHHVTTTMSPQATESLLKAAQKDLLQRIKDGDDGDSTVTAEDDTEEGDLDDVG